MSSQGIIGQTPALLSQMQIGFTGLEKYLYIPYADILEMPTKILLNPHV